MNTQITALQKEATQQTQELTAQFTAAAGDAATADDGEQFSQHLLQSDLGRIRRLTMNGTRQEWGVAGAYRAVEGIGAAPEDFMKMGLDAARNLLLRAEAAIAAGDRVEKAQALSSAGNIVEFMLGLSGSRTGRVERMPRQRVSIRPGGDPQRQCRGRYGSRRRGARRARRACRHLAQDLSRCDRLGGERPRTGTERETRPCLIRSAA